MKWGNDDWRLWWPGLRKRALKRYGYRCAICGHKGSPDNALQVDHILPRSIFPQYRKKLWNLQPLCREHNKAKSYRHWNDFRPWRGYTGAKLRVLLARLSFELRRKY